MGDNLATATDDEVEAEEERIATEDGAVDFPNERAVKHLHAYADQLETAGNVTEAQIVRSDADLGEMLIAFGSDV